MRLERDRVKVVLALVGCALLVAMSLAACGSSSSSTESGGSTESNEPAETEESNEGGETESAGGANAALVEEAKQRVEEAMKPLTEFPGPTKPTGKPPTGKTIAVVKVVPAPFPVHQAEGVEAAAKAVGWTTRAFTADGTPKGIEETMSTALSTKPDAIVLAAMPAAFMQQQLAQAKRENIPVVALTPGLPPGKSPEEWNLLNVVKEPSKQTGRDLAYWIIANSPEGAEAIALTSPEFEDFNEISDEFQKTLKEGAPEFSVAETVASPVTDSGGGQTGVNRLASPMKKHPDADYMFILSESWISTFLQAEVSAGRGEEVTALGSNGDTAIPLIQEGKKIVISAAASKGLGWYAVDAFIRFWNGKPQEPEYEAVHTLVDSENADEYETEYVEAKYNTEEEWLKIWK